MAMTVKKLRDWVATLDDDGVVGIDDGGLCLVETDASGTETGAYLEIGGTLRDDDE